MESLRDPQGCLTPAGFDAMARAPVGQAPSELAQHVASCSKCQERLLAGSPVSRRRPKREPPPPWRVWLVVAAAALFVLFVLLTLRRLTL